MFDFLEWYFPWSRIDGVLKLQLVLWFVSVAAAILIYLWTIVLGKPWLILPVASDADEDGDKHPTPQQSSS